jgi:hypothetical protein
MSLIIKSAKTAPIRIEIDLETDQGAIKGYFTGHAYIRSKPQLAELQQRFDAMAQQDMAPLVAEEKILREMYARFEGLANEAGPIEGDAAFAELLQGPLSVHLAKAATDAYWSFLSGSARQGNAPRSRAR